MTSQEAYLKRHKELVEEAHQLTDRKNKDYADPEDAFANFNMLGTDYALIGIVVRLGDKLRRLLKDAEAVKAGNFDVLQNESAHDSCLDVINYATLYKCIREELENAK